MPRRNKNNNHRGRGGGRGRGRGRGRGGPNHGVPTTAAPATAAASRAPRHPYPHTNAEIDVVIQQWTEPSTVPGANVSGNVNRGNNHWRGGAPNSRSGAGTPLRGMASPRRGASTPRGRGWGRGWGRGRRPDDGGDPFSGPRRPHLGVGVGGKAKTIIGKDAPLSDLLYSERPLLRPVKFVRAKMTPFLFQHSEDVLKSAVEVADTTETSHVPTADCVARLFHGSGAGTGTGSDTDSESEGHAQDALEEIDFADMARVRAEVDAIAQGAATATMDQNAHKDEEDIEEVDFADLAAIRAKVDAAEPQAVSRYGTIQEAFTGVYNKIKDTTQVSSTRDVVDDDQPYGVQQTASLSTSPALDDSLNFKPSIEISSLYNHHESFTHDQDTIVVEEEVPCSSNALLNVPVEEPSLPTAPETHLVTVLTDDIPLYPDTPSHHDPHPLFVVDTAPAHPFPFTSRSASEVILVDRTGHGETLGDQDEERIVYVAPHPRSRRASPVPPVPRVKLPQTSMLTGRSVEVGGLRSPVREDDAGPTMPDRDRTRAGLEAEVGEDHHLSLASLTLGPTTSEFTAPPTRPPHTNTAVRARKKEVRFQRQNKRGRLGFGAYGAMVSEARLREEDVRERRSPRWETRRRGDSDVDWGTEDEDQDQDQDGEGEEGDGVDAVSDGLGGMEIDPDLEIDVDAMQGFLKSMSAEGSRLVTMDDIEDEARMRREDEEGQGGPSGSSDSERGDEEEAEVDEGDEEEEVFNIEEEILIAESEGDEEFSENSDDDDDELSPRSDFQARLRKIREQGRGQHPKSVQEISDDEEEDTPEFLPWTRSANDEEFIAHINDLIEENSQIISGCNREQKKAVFRNLHQGYVDDPEFTTPVNKKTEKKGKGKQATGSSDAKLEAQWAKDRAKKAERKLERQTARFLAALDPLSAEPGSTSRKAMRAAARLNPTAALSIAPRAIVDMVSLEAQMRRFVEDVGGRSSMALPPMNKGMRKRVHDMAAAFGVNSVSKGKGVARYTTLIKTSRTGVNEGKVRALMKRYGGKGYSGGKGGEGEGRGRGGGRMPRHRDGDEVGKEAPKIGENNIGFKMLTSMGWSEGNRIGGTVSVGIEAPLTAIIKNSKLGLGATR